MKSALQAGVGTRVEPICRGRHNRFIVAVPTSEVRLAAQARKAGPA